MAKNDSLPPLGFLRTFDMLKKTPLGVRFNINSFCCNLFEVSPILSKIDWNELRLPTSLILGLHCALIDILSLTHSFLLDGDSNKSRLGDLNDRCI